MFSHLAILLFACLSTLAVPVDDELGTQSPAIPALPEELLSKIVDLADDDDCLTVGCVSRVFNKISEARNSNNRLSLIRNHCGFMQYFQLTSNGHLILSKNIIDPLNQLGRVLNPKNFIEEETLCIRTLRSNIRAIADKHIVLQIYLPDATLELSPELERATESYFEVLDDLFKAKKNFEKISVYSVSRNGDEMRPKFLYQEHENKLFELLSPLNIDFIDIQFKVRNPQLFVNPSIKKLGAQKQFFTSNNHPELANLNSVIFPPIYWSYQNIQDRSNILRIARSESVKELTLPHDLTSIVLTDQYFVEKLDLFGTERNISLARTDYLEALINTDKELKGLKFGKNLFTPIGILSAILEKFKPSLNSLSLYLLSYSHNEWEGMLSNLLAENDRLNDLEVNLEDGVWDDTFSHLYLKQAVNLTSYSFTGAEVTGAHIQPLFDFIATHKTLKSLSLKFDSLYFTRSVTASSFYIFYEGLVGAVLSNPSIERLQLGITITVPDKEEFAKLLSEKTRPLAGRGLIMNSVPVDNVVSDLAEGLKGGLQFNRYIYQSHKVILA